MTFVQWLWRSELAALGALVGCAAAVAVYGFADAVRIGPTSLISPTGTAWLGFGYTTTIGALPTILYGAPIYALLAHKRLASWPAVIALGAIPGMLLLLVETWLGGWSLGCGLVVATVTHLLMQRWARRSNSAVESDASESALGASSSAPHRER